MFEYRTRTERKNGCKFIEQDILLYDYIYDNDISIECHLSYQRPGFGFVLSEQQNNIAISDNTYIFKIDSPNHYQIIGKAKGEQTIVRSEYINAGATFSLNQDLILIFDYLEDSKVNVYIVEKNSNKTNNKHLAFSYAIPHIIDKYKIGFYSNAGNTLKFAAISSESPNNWISNIFNGNGGRINWIKNGFEIQECEFNCEVESQINQLDAGIYYFDFESTNKDIKYYIYPSYRKNSKDKRLMDEVMATKEDERKNILDYSSGSFALSKPENINIKFVGKSGKITNIAIKKIKTDSFVETDYDNIKRESSSISFDLSKIKKIEMAATIYETAADYYLFLNGVKKYNIQDFNIEIGSIFDCVIENNQIFINNIINKTSDNDTELKCLKNTNSVVSKLIVTYNNGDVVDIINQKTVKITVDKNVKSPIIVTDKNKNSLELSSSYRKIIVPRAAIDIFNRFRQIKLSKTLSIANNNIYVFGFDGGKINFEADSLDKLDIEYELISPNNYKIDHLNNKINIDKTVRDQYKFIGVLYHHIDDYRYEFTNWEREIFSLADGYIYLKNRVNDSMIVYGVPKSSDIYKDRLYYISGKELINSIDEVAAQYNILTESEYVLDSTTNKLIILNPEEYDYIIVDYLKNNSYSVNERNLYYEVDISGSSPEYRILYDNIEKQYKVLDLTNLEADELIVLDKNNKKE